MIRAALPRRREVPWLLAGIVLATMWFTANRFLPPLFRGDVCCDSTGYVKIAEKLAGIHIQEAVPTTHVSPEQSSQSSPKKPLSLSLGLSLFTRIFTYSGYTPPGFPLFLAAHAFVLKTIGLGSLPWLPIALSTALLLHILASFFFYRSWSSIGWNLHPIALTLLIAHPGLTSHAALPLADSLAITLMMIGIGCFLRISSTRSIVWAISGGVFLAGAVLTKTSHFPAAFLTLIGTLMLPLLLRFIIRTKDTSLGSFGHLCAVYALCALSFLFVLSPRLIACTASTGHLCFSEPPSQGEPLTANLIRTGLTGARTYTILTPDGSSALVTLTDPFFDKFRRECTIDNLHPVSSLLSCLLSHPLQTPIFLVKKSIGLFDNFHWNTYATYVTPLPVIILNRLFGFLGFLGFLTLFITVALDIIRSPRRLLDLTPLLFPLAFFAMGILLMIESRYGLPLAPFGIIGAVLLIQRGWKQQRVLLSISAVLGLLFLVQTFAWDRSDPFPYRPVPEALQKLSMPPLEAPLIPVH